MSADEDLTALLRAATELREADRRDEAAARYAEVVERFGDRYEAAAAEIWLARFAGDDGDHALSERRFASVRDRLPALGDHGRLMSAEVHAELASYHLLLRADADAGLADLRRTVAVTDDPATIARADNLENALRLSLSLLANNGLPETAWTLAERAVRYALDAGDPGLAARIAVAEGTIYQDGGDERAAYEAFLRGIRAFGDAPAELPLAQLLNSAGLAADHLGEYTLSATHYERALELRRRHLAPDDPDLLLSRYNLAEILRVTGQRELAADELKAVADALAARDDDEQAWLLSVALKNLADALVKLKRPAEAEAAALQALAVGGQRPIMRAQLYVTLAMARRDQGHDLDVETELEATLEQVIAEHGEGSRAHLWLLGSLALLGLRDDESAVYAWICERAAEQDGFEAFNLRGWMLGNLAAAQWRDGDTDGALAAFTQSLEALETVRAESWRLRTTLEPSVEDPWPLREPLLRLAVGLPGHADAHALAFRAAVGGKRLQAEAIAAQNELILQGRTELIAVRELAARLRRAQVWEDAPEPDLEALEDVLARGVPREALLGLARDSTAAAVAEAMPGNATLVEYVRCDGFTWKGAAERLDDWYGVFVLPGGRPEALTFVELGDAETIDEAAHAMREAVIGADGRTSTWRESARRLAELVWDPVAPQLAESYTLIAPDGALCAVPFDALIDADGEPLVRTQTLTTLATGRDVHRLATRANWRSGEPLVIAAPEYGEPWEPFGPLLGAIDEGSAIADLLGVDPVSAEAATRELLLGADDAEILHLATHGYYLSADTQDSGFAARIAAAAQRHPLVSSGIALAGANALDAPGVVSALDIIGLPLAGTDLVVLSACESGLGELDDEEGLLGLARSFLLGGARSVVWSLWEVPDAETRLAMESLYRRLIGGYDRAVAMREVKRELYALAPERPWAWAGFVLQGDPAGLLRYRFLVVAPDQTYDRRVTETDGVFQTPSDERLVANFALDFGDADPLRVASMSLRNSSVPEGWDAYYDGQGELEAGDLDGARAQFSAALEHAAAAAQPPPLLAALTQDRLAILAGLQDSLESAREHGLAAFALLAAIGPSADLAVVLDNLGTTEFNLGDHAGGRARLVRALEMKRQMLPPGDPQLAYTEGVIAQMDAALGT